MTISWERSRLKGAGRHLHTLRINRLPVDVGVIEEADGTFYALGPEEKSIEEVKGSPLATLAEAKWVGCRKYVDYLKRQAEWINLALGEKPAGA